MRVLLMMVLLIPMLASAVQLEVVAVSSIMYTMDEVGFPGPAWAVPWQDGDPPIRIETVNFTYDGELQVFHYDTLFSAAMVFRLPPGYQWDNNESIMYDYPLATVPGVYYLQYRPKAELTSIWPSPSDGYYVPWMADGCWMGTILFQGFADRFFVAYYNARAHVMFLNSPENGGMGAVPPDQAEWPYMVVWIYTLNGGAAAELRPDAGPCGPVRIIQSQDPPDDVTWRPVLPNFSEVDVLFPDPGTMTYNLGVQQQSAPASPYMLLCDFRQTVLDTVLGSIPSTYSLPLEYSGRADHLALVNAAGGVTQRVALATAVDVLGAPPAPQEDN